MLVGWAPLDLVATPMDDLFREPEVVDDGSQLGTDGRTEGTEVRLLAQVEDDEFEKLQMLDSGDTPDSSAVIIHHFKDLEAAGYVDADGNATFPKKGDRLNAIYKKNGAIVWKPRNPPGLFVEEATPISMGFGGHRNLLKVVVNDREKGVR